MYICLLLGASHTNSLHPLTTLEWRDVLIGIFEPAAIKRTSSVNGIVQFVQQSVPVCLSINKCIVLSLDQLKILSNKTPRGGEYKWFRAKVKHKRVLHRNSQIATAHLSIKTFCTHKSPLGNFDNYSWPALCFISCGWIAAPNKRTVRIIIICEFRKWSIVPGN